MRAATPSSRAHGRYQFVSRIAVAIPRGRGPKGDAGHRSRPPTQPGVRLGDVPEGKGRRPARYCVKLLVDSTAIVIVAFLVSLGRRPCAATPQSEDRPSVTFHRLRV